MNSLSLWHINEHQSELRQETEKIDQKNCLVEALYSMISTGTERMVARALVSTDMSEKMVVPYMQGSFELPIKYGYSLVGRQRMPDGTDNIVHLLHPHQSIAAVLASDLYVVPNNIPAKRATLLSNMETIVNAIWDAETLLNENGKSGLTIAICGFGNIGALLTITLNNLFAHKIIIVEPDEWRAQKANEMGFETLHPSQNSGVFDILFHTSCTQAGLDWCIKHTDFESTIIELSWYATITIQINLGGHFHYNRVRLISSQVSNIPKCKPDETYLSRKNYAAQLLTNKEYDQLFADDIPFSKALSFFDKLRNNSLTSGIVWCFKY
jgi:hypothetical protein